LEKENMGFRLKYNTETQNTIAKKTKFETTMVDPPLWQWVRSIEQENRVLVERLGKIAATLVVNYGNEGRCIKGVVNSNEPPNKMLMKVLEKVNTELKQLKQDYKDLREAAKMIDWKYLIWFLTNNADPYEPEKGDRPTTEMIMVGDLKKLQQALVEASDEG
jgi:hypothetical protein